MKVLDLIMKEKNSFAEVAKIYGKNESSIHEIVRKEKQIHAGFAFALQTAKVTGRFPGDAVVKNPPANAGDLGSSPGPGRSHMPRSN